MNFCFQNRYANPKAFYTRGYSFETKYWRESLTSLRRVITNVIQWNITDGATSF
jgi:hypothetical protein